MPEWMADPGSSESSLSWDVLLARLVLALVLVTSVGGIFRLTHGRGKPDAPAMTATLILMAVLIAMVSLVIGNSVARAFSLVGALSIVRFRTVVEDTRDTAFVIFAVLVGMAVGVGQFLVTLVGIPVVAVAAIALQFRSGPGRSDACIVPLSKLRLRLGLDRPPDALIDEAIAGHAEDFHVVSSSTARQGASVDVTYAVRLKPAANHVQLVSQLNQIEGIQSAELVERMPPCRK